MPSSWPPSLGCTGSTTSASSAASAMSPQPSSKQPSTLPNKPPPSGSETNSPSLHQTQADSDGDRHHRLAKLRRVTIEGQLTRHPPRAGPDLDGNRRVRVCGRRNLEQRMDDDLDV